MPIYRAATRWDGTTPVYLRITVCPNLSDWPDVCTPIKRSRSACLAGGYFHPNRDGAP